MSAAPTEILHRDDQLVVVNKPAGVLVHRTELAPDRDVLMMRVRDLLGAHVWPVHRLDRGTSGAVVFALSSERAHELALAFEHGEVEKRYLALARGEPPSNIEVDYPVPRGEGKARVPARTRFRLLHAGGWFSLVEAEPMTGRYHQIRRHLAHLRHPVGNDSNYGTGWFNRKLRADAELHRLALHAASLTLPVPGGVLRVEAPLPPDLSGALQRLGVAWPFAALPPSAPPPLPGEARAL